jgi:hypothetical protein
VLALRYSTSVIDSSTAQRLLLACLPFSLERASARLGDPPSASYRQSTFSPFALSMLPSGCDPKLYQKSVSIVQGKILDSEVIRGLLVKAWREKCARRFNHKTWKEAAA